MRAVWVERWTQTFGWLATGVIERSRAQARPRLHLIPPQLSQNYSKLWQSLHKCGRHFGWTSNSLVQLEPIL